MIKKLLLLGLLRGQKLHGYGLLEYLQNHTMGGASIGKSNAYRLLKVMEHDGLIRSVTERDGNLPERYVYEVTPNGEAFFQDTLLKELAKDATADQPGIAVLNYLETLDPAAAADQLQVRRDKVAAREAELANVPEEVRDLHPALDLGLRQVVTELEWLDEKLRELRKRTRSAA
jgi:DNA-binding PadR family transcriptional regulator